MSTVFQTYFVGHVVHLINRTPTPLLDNITPYEKSYKKPLDYGMLRTFGCLVFVSTLERNRTKFDNRFEKGIFLGYEAGMKGFRVYCLNNNRVVVSRNVRFHKNIFPHKKALDEAIDESDQAYNKEISEEEHTNTKETESLGNRKTSRNHKQPEYLKDYYCSMIENKSVTELEERTSCIIYLSFYLMINILKTISFIQ